MRRIIKYFGLFLMVICCLIFIFIYFIERHDIVLHNRIISGVFNDSSDYINNDYIGYISIPKINIKRVIKYGTNSNVLDGGYVGLYENCDDLSNDDLIILAGHNISSIFGKLHIISIGDVVIIGNRFVHREFIVYKKEIINEKDDYILKQNRKNELLLVTCDKKGYRLVVFLKEDL